MYLTPEEQFRLTGSVRPCDLPDLLDAAAKAE